MARKSKYKGGTKNSTFRLAAEAVANLNTVAEALKTEPSSAINRVLLGDREAISALLDVVKNNVLRNG